MPRTLPPSLTTAELSVLKALWALGPSTVAEVRRYLGDVSAYTTVMTLLSRLAQKHAVAVDRAREPFLYTSKVSRDQVQGARVRELVTTVFDGSASSMVMGLLSSASLSAEELRELSAQIRERAAAIDQAAEAATSDGGAPSNVPGKREGTP